MSGASEHQPSPDNGAAQPAVRRSLPRRSVLAAALTVPALGASLSGCSKTPSAAAPPVILCPPPGRQPDIAANYVISLGLSAYGPPQSTDVAEAASSLNAAHTPKVFPLASMSREERNGYFHSKTSVESGTGVMRSWTGITGPGELQVFGFLTDAITVDLICTQVQGNQPITVLIDGEKIENLARATKAGTSQPLGIRLSFQRSRFRRIELIGKLGIKEVQLSSTETCSSIWPYVREGIAVGVLGDEWIDTSLGKAGNIGAMLASDRQLNTVISAAPDTGITRSTQASGDFTADSRVGALAKTELDAAVLFSDLTKDAADPERLRTKMTEIVTRLRQKNPEIKILITGPEKKEGTAAGILSSLASKNLVIKPLPAAETLLGAESTKGWELSPQSAAAAGEWLIAEVKALTIPGTPTPSASKG